MTDKLTVGQQAALQEALIEHRFVGRRFIDSYDRPAFAVALCSCSWKMEIERKIGGKLVPIAQSAIEEWSNHLLEEADKIGEQYRSSDTNATAASRVLRRQLRNWWDLVEESVRRLHEAGYQGATLPFMYQVDGGCYAYLVLESGEVWHKEKVYPPFLDSGLRELAEVRRRNVIDVRDAFSRYDTSAYRAYFEWVSGLRKAVDEQISKIKAVA